MGKEKSLSKKDWMVLLIIGFTGFAAFNIQDAWVNTFIFDSITPNPNVIAFKTAFQAIAATMGTFLIGTMSDRAGKRKPFMMAGLSIWGVLAVMLTFVSERATANVTMAIVSVVGMSIAMAFSTSMTYDSTYNAWTTDVSNKENRGTIVAISSMLPMGVILIMSAAGAIIDGFGYRTFFIGAGVIIAGLTIFAASMVDDSRTKKSDSENHFIKDLIGVFSKESIRENKKIFLLFLFGCFMLTGQAIFQSFDLIYLTKNIGLSKTTASLLGIFIVPATIVCSIIAGKMNDNGKADRVLLAAPMLFAVGLLGFSFSSKFALLALFKVIMVASTVVMMVTVIVKTKNLMPENKRGQFEGVRMVFFVLTPLVLGPTIGTILINIFGVPTVINGVNGFIPSAMIYQAAAVLSLMSYPVFIAIKKVDRSR